MKIIITEKQYKKLTNPKIDCKCGHSWDVEKNDKHIYAICVDGIIMIINIITKSY